MGQSWCCFAKNLIFLDVVWRIAKCLKKINPNGVALSSSLKLSI